MGECENDPNLVGILTYCGDGLDTAINWTLCAVTLLSVVFSLRSLRGSWSWCWAPLAVFLFVFQVRVSPPARVCVCVCVRVSHVLACRGPSHGSHTRAHAGGPDELLACVRARLACVLQLPAPASASCGVRWWPSSCRFCSSSAGQAQRRPALRRWSSPSPRWCLASSPGRTTR